VELKGQWLKWPEPGFGFSGFWDPSAKIYSGNHVCFFQKGREQEGKTREKKYKYHVYY